MSVYDNLKSKDVYPKAESATAKEIITTYNIVAS